MIPSKEIIYKIKFLWSIKFEVLQYCTLTKEGRGRAEKSQYPCYQCCKGKGKAGVGARAGTKVARLGAEVGAPPAEWKRRPILRLRTVLVAGGARCPVGVGPHLGEQEQEQKQEQKQEQDKRGWNHSQYWPCSWVAVVMPRSYHWSQTHGTPVLQI